MPPWLHAAEVATSTGVGGTSPAINLERSGQTEGRQASGRTTAIPKCKPGAASHPPSRRGFLQVRRSYIGPSSSDARVSTRTRPLSKAHPGRCLRPRLDANLPQRRCRPRHPRPPPTPLYFHNPVQQQTSPRGRGGADFLFFLIARPGSLGTIPTARRRFSFASNSLLYVTPYTTTTTTTTIYYIATNTNRGCIFFSFSFLAFPPSECVRGKGWWWWWCRLPCLARV